MAVQKTLYTVKPRYNEPLCNEVLGVTNNFLYHSNSKMHEKEPLSIIIMKPRYSEQILPGPWPFVRSRFYCTILYIFTF